MSTFPDHAAGNKKAPDHSVRGFGSDDASFDYARTPSEPPEGLVLVAVLVVADIMGADLWARLAASSTDFATKIVKQRLNRVVLVRDKPLP